MLCGWFGLGLIWCTNRKFWLEKGVFFIHTSTFSPKIYDTLPNWKLGEKLHWFSLYSCVREACPKGILLAPDKVSHREKPKELQRAEENPRTTHKRPSVHI